MNELSRHLIEEGVLKSQPNVEAFQKVNRSDFLPPDQRPMQDFDLPLPIGSGQTNSQPYTVALMLELLRVKQGQKVLDVGFGSGWTTALLAAIVGKPGKVYALERIKEVYFFGKKNLEKYNFENIYLHFSDGCLGLPKAAPFDRILVSAAAEKIPKNLLNQLKIGGIMVIPTTDGKLHCLAKLTDGKISEKVIGGFSFVPLLNDTK